MSAHEPLREVRKNFRISWYRCPIEPEQLRQFTRRSDLRAAFQAVGHLLLLAVTGTAVWLLFDLRIWPAFALVLFAHCTIYSFLSGVAGHELSHGTVFRTKWLNSIFLHFISLISWFNFRDYKMSHTYHHLYTLHPRGDRELVLPTIPTLHPLFLLQMFTVNLVGDRREPYSFPVVQNVASMVKLAFTGKFSADWLEDVYADQPVERGRSIAWARIVLAFNAIVIVVSLIFKLWMLPVLVTFAPFAANWLRYFVAIPMHTGLRDNVPDFRKCVRSITLDPFSQFLYWSMNWHLEHHMFAAVPCYSLKKFHAAVASDMPPTQNLFSAWREIRQIWNKQKKDPGFQFDTPLPPPRSEKVRKQDPLESSIGDLAPKGLE